jgi:hypothetical protein
MAASAIPEEAAIIWIVSVVVVVEDFFQEW